MSIMQQGISETTFTMVSTSRNSDVPTLGRHGEDDQIVAD